VIVPDGTFRVHLVDGTYELFRHHFGALAAARKGESGPPESGPTRAAARGVVATVLGMLEGGATHLGVATDHVIESFRNDLWAGYKSSEGVPEELLAQFGLVEDGLVSLGVKVWPMVELEADDALGSAAAVAAEDPRVEQVLICTPDKDLGQSVIGRRVVQLDRRADKIIDEDGVRAKFGVGPESVADWLALVGDSADGFPGIPGWGAKTAAAVLSHYSSIEAIPGRAEDWDPPVRSSVRSAARLATDLAAAMDAALLFRTLATLRIDRDLLESVDALGWTGPQPDFEVISAELGAPNLWNRAQRLAASRPE
jgi:5'-3' exonuclease